jgi:hypothetical protein
MNTMMELLLGFIAGAVIASGLWALLWALLKNERRDAKQRTTIMEEIAVDCAEIENQIVSRTMNKSSASTFRSAVSPRLDKITKKLATNMHIVDVYYVKYVESLIERYRLALLDHDDKAGAAKIEKQIAVDEIDSEHLDKTWQFDFSKEKSDGALLDKQSDKLDEKPITIPAVPEMKAQTPTASAIPATLENKPLPPKEPEESVFEAISSPDSGIKDKDTKVIMTENIPVSKQSEIEKIIMAELRGESPDEAPAGKDEIAETQKAEASAAVEFESVPDSKAAIDNTIPDDKNEKTAPPATRKEETFISGEDLIAKLDSFFGIKE